MFVETKTDLSNVQQICSPAEKRAGGGWGQSHRLSEIGNRVANGKLRFRDRIAPVAFAGAAANGAQLHHIADAGTQTLEQDRSRRPDIREVGG